MHSSISKVTPLFSYQSEKQTAEKLTLSLLFGQHLAAYLWVDSVSQTALKGAFYQIDHWNNNNFIEEFLTISLPTTSTSYTVQVCFDASQLVQMPIANYDQSKLNLLQKVAYPHNPSMRSLHESFASWQFYLSYHVPAYLINKLESQFVDLNCFHTANWLLMNRHASDEAGEFLVHVGIAQLSIVLCKGGRLLFVGYYDYQHEMDAVFYLLKLAAAHDLSTASVQLSLAGLIDPSSRLYEEFSNYFLQVKPLASTIQFTGDAPSAHYFTLLSNHSLCVS
ncbi:MAG: DUF3822 family protein [Bacteroidetes bacterium]|nr:DUF3822 family protein [Bacteroidota bacterium]